MHSIYIDIALYVKGTQLGKAVQKVYICTLKGILLSVSYLLDQS